MQHSLSQYKTFYEVAKAENVSKAARILLISQPAVSKSIKKLEKSLGVKLFDRTTVGTNLTSEGKLLFEYLTIAFNQINDAELKLKTFSDINFGHLRIGSSETLCKRLLMSYINIYTRTFPNIRLSINTMHTRKAYERLEDKQIDLALVYKKDTDHKDIIFMPLMKIQDCFVASKDYLEYFNKVFTNKPDFFTNGNILLLNKKNITREAIDTIFEKHDIFPKQILEINNLELLIDFVKNSVGIGAVIKEFVKEELENKELIEIPLRFNMPKRTIGFAYNRNNITKELNDFINIIKLDHEHDDHDEHDEHEEHEEKLKVKK